MIRRLLDRLRMWARIQNTQAEPTPYKYQNLEEDLKRIQEHLRRRQEAGPAIANGQAKADERLNAL